ncbi:hypothetical protein GOP47_0022863 [Adiantum capillus-veneris]|uniref:Glutaredoxin domain-containing protein n=1 Tax=Adiantum capillus-veneris TaxID=13818 RepID=A0A9D4U853_ADICA|nr:hypothetical protein GOP47_0022863 [Adiantum capillus-veneris]
MFPQQRRHVFAVVLEQRKKGGGAGKVLILILSFRNIMGCAFSKEVESPTTSLKETSSWDKMIHRRFTIQINRSLRTKSDGSYVAAIFSANYGILRKHAPVKPLDSKVFLQNSSTSESCVPTHARCPIIKSDAIVHTNSVEDTVVPVSSIKSTSDSLEPEGSTSSTKESLETIDILELMKGLGEEDVSANFENLHEFSSNLVLPEIKQTSSTIVSCKPSDKLHATDIVSANKRTRKQRPKSSSSINLIGSVEDVDMALSARRGITLSPLMSSREVHQHKKKMMVAPFGQTILDQNIHPHDENGVISIPECTSITTIDDPLSQKRETLQREISFKYMFNHNSGSERKNSLYSNVDALHTPVHEATAAICISDSLAFATAHLYEGEGTGSPSSPQFSTTTSLKDWLPSSSHPLTPAISLLSDRKCPISETLHILPSQSASNYLPTLQCQDRLELEDFGIPVFDPEMVDSFENAVRNLSKEEWNAVRSIEDSPHNFLRLVKALRKSRSNSVCSQNKNAENLNFDTMKPDSNAGKDAKDCCEPWKLPDRKCKYAENMRAFMRQNSLDIGKAFFQVRARDDTGMTSVVFYSTAEVGSKAYEDCSHVRSILQSLMGISFEEKSVSEHQEDEQELRHALNISVAIVPTIYVRGKYIVGIDNILHLHKKGLLGSMLREAGG